MRFKAKIDSKAERTRQYVSISRRFSTPQRAARGFFNSLLAVAERPLVGQIQKREHVPHRLNVSMGQRTCDTKHTLCRKKLLSLEDSTEQLNLFDGKM
jgi:hypothetical protein